MLRTRCALACGVLWLGWSGTAHAYLDPGTGSMLLQLLVGGAAGAAVLGKLVWRRLSSFWPLRRRDDHERG